MRTRDGSGSGRYAAIETPRLSGVDAVSLAERAAVKAETSAKPRDLAAGKYPVILEPQAVADLLGGFIRSLDGRAAEEGRSYFSKPGGGTRAGDKVFAESITLRSDPTDPRAAWLTLGPRRVLRTGRRGRRTASSQDHLDRGGRRPCNLTYDRYWAKKTGREPLPFSGSLIMDGGSGSLEDLIAQTERALLITRFWYIRVVNPRARAFLTGLDPRRRSWLVEKGRRYLHPGEQPSGSTTARSAFSRTLTR